MARYFHSVAWTWRRGFDDEEERLHMRSWGVRWRGTIVLTAALLAAACGGEKKQPGQQGNRTGNPAAARGGTAVVGMKSDFGPLNPLLATDQYTIEINDYALFTPLVQFDSALDAVPYLARSWEMTADTGIVFHLRHDVRWHDGQPVTAQDVKFTFDMAKDPATASYLADAYLANVDRATVVDSFTVRFHFSRPHAQAIQDFWWAPVPEHVLRNVQPAQMRNADFNRHPVGSGPFHFEEWRANDRLVLTREMLFPDSLGGPPPLDRVVFRIIPEAATIMTELVSGGVQVDIPLNPEQTNDIKRNPKLKLFAYPSRTVYFIAWNNQRPPFNDPRVRTAMTLAINRQQITDAILRGFGKVATGPIPPWSPLHPDVDPLPYDSRKAQQLLAEAGYKTRPGQPGVYGPNGQQLHLTLITSNAAVQQSVAEIVQAQLKQVGVAVDVRALEFQTFLSQYKSKDFDAALANWQMDNFQVAAAPRALFSSALAKVPNSTNRAGVVSPKLDALIAAGGAATDDSDARDDWKKFAEELQKEQPFTFLFWYSELAATRDGLNGVVMDPRGELQSVASWWFTGGRAR